MKEKRKLNMWAFFIVLLYRVHSTVAELNEVLTDKYRALMLFVKPFEVLCHSGRRYTSVCILFSGFQMCVNPS